MTTTEAALIDETVAKQQMYLRNAELERKVRCWLEGLVEAKFDDEADTHSVLKDGRVLCK